MRKSCYFYFLIFIVSLSYTFNVYAAIEWVEILFPETIVDVLNDVPAVYTNESNPDDDPVYSCVALVKNYYKQVYGVSVYNLINDGPPLLFENTDSLVEVSNPRVGDIIFYSKSVNKNNHSALVKEVNGNEITLIEQNWKSGTRAGRYRTISYPSSNFSIWRLKSQVDSSELFDNYYNEIDKDKSDELSNELNNQEASNQDTSSIYDDFQQEAVPVFNPILPSEENVEVIEKEPEVEPPSPPITKTFTDLTESHWSYEYVNKCVANGIFDGYSDGSFRPNNIITRGEFAKLICSALKIKVPTSETLSFSDVYEKDWYSDYIENAKNYLSGYWQGDKQYYKPKDPALREDICIALIKMINAENVIPDVNLDFSDKARIKEEAEKYIQLAVQFEIIQGFNDGTIRPKEPITRAQAAVLISKAFEY